jgi:transposase
VAPEINDEDVAWVTSVACQSPGDYGYAHETWTYSLLASHISKNCEQNGHPNLKKAGKSLIHGILNKVAVKPHKIQSYLEKRDEQFEEKMAQVLAVYKDVAIINKNEEKEREEIRNEDVIKSNEAVKQNTERKSTTISYDEKPGIQALKNIGAQLLPVAGKHTTVSRDYEYKRLGTLSLLAGIDLHSGNVIPLVTAQHRSEEFIQFLKKTEASYPSDWKIRIILDNHSAHRSKETMNYLATVPGKFELVFTPTHGSWLNMIEMFFSKVARGFLRHIRVNTIEELKKRIYLGIDLINKEPVVFRWAYKIEDSVIKNE